MYWTLYRPRFCRE